VLLTYLGKFWYSRYLQPPALVVCQVEVESVHLVLRHHVKELLDVRRVKEVTTHVKMESSILEPEFNQ